MFYAQVPLPNMIFLSGSLQLAQLQKKTGSVVGFGVTTEPGLPDVRKGKGRARRKKTQGPTSVHQQQADVG